MTLKKIKLLIVDDSAIVRNVLSTELGKQPDIEIIATAPDPYIARDKIIQHKPDVITLDVEMPRMDGVTFLGKLMKSHPLPVIILSTLTPAGCETANTALQFGAFEVLEKPKIDLSYKLNEMITNLANTIRAAAASKERIKQRANDPKTAIASFKNNAAMIKTTDKVFCIGASTGGTEAIRAILPALPANFPGIIIAQHMPENFTKSFSNSLNNQCAMDVKEAENNDTIRPGLVIIARGNYHLLARRSGARYFVELKDGPMIHHQRPAVDITFESASRYIGRNAIGIILTGMGKDGAAGLLKMKNAGSYTIGQDEKSCVVYGMPKAAFEAGGVDHVLPLSEIPKRMMQLAAQE